MCLSNTAYTPQLGDAPAFASMLEDASHACTQEQLAHATLLKRASTLIRHLEQLAVADESAHQKVLSTLAQVRALAETERQAGNGHWTRAVLLIDAAIEELEA